MGAMIAGQATAEGTARYAARFADLPAEHFRELHGVRLSTVGLGTYLGRDDASPIRSTRRRWSAPSCAA